MLAALAVLASWPFFPTLGYWPMTADPPTWIALGTPLSDEWLTWVFAADHYSWYRPVAALSFAFNQVLSDVNPWALRLTDLGLHLLVGLLAGAVFRRWVPQTSPWAGVLVSALVWMHPIAEEVVPYMARRSYSLSAAFGLAALWVLHGTVTRVLAGASSTRSSLLLGVLLVLALLSNESALTIVLVVPLFTATLLQGRPQGVARAVRLLLPAAVVVALAMALRCWILGGLGGYGESAQQPAPLAGILGPLWAALTGFEVWSSALGGWGGASLAVLVGVYYMNVARRGLHAEAAPAERLLLVGLAWLALAGLLYLLSGIYTARQAYGLQVPLAFVLVGAWSARRSWFDAVAPVLVLGALLGSAPVVHGQQPGRLAGWAERQALLTALIEDLPACEQPAVVRLVLPNMRPHALVLTAAGGGARVRLHRSIRQPTEWVGIALHERELAPRDFVYFPRDGQPARLEQRRGRPCLVLPTEGPLYQRRGEEFATVAGGSVLWLDELSWPAGTNGYVYVYSSAGGRLELLQRAQP